MLDSPGAGATAGILLAVVVLGGCVPLRYPQAGHPIALRSNETLVFGRIRMLNQDQSLEYLPFSTDPLDHLPPDPLLFLQLSWLDPPGHASEYKLYPGPRVEKDGSFYWLVPAGRYLVLGNPRPFGSERFDDAGTTPLARFSVPPGGGLVYLGTLVLRISIGAGDAISGWRGRGWMYSIEASRVDDERRQAYARLAERFPGPPATPAVALMVP